MSLRTSSFLAVTSIFGKTVNSSITYIMKVIIHYIEYVDCDYYLGDIHSVNRVELTV